MKKGDVTPSGYVVGRGRTPLNLTERHIRYAMNNTKSNSEAARFLNISLTTYQKYAKMHIDDETGKTLWEIQKNKRGAGIKKPHNVTKGKWALKDILEGKHPEYSVHRLKNRLISAGNKVDFPYECHECGYSEKRIVDGTIPLILDHMNDDWTDHRKENLRFLCYNCFHNLRGNIRGKQPQWRYEQLKKVKKKKKKDK